MAAGNKASSHRWKQYYQMLPGDDEGNQNMSSFSEFYMNTKADEVSNLRELVEDQDTVFLGVDNGNVLILHSPKYFGGT